MSWIWGKSLCTPYQTLPASSVNYRAVWHPEWRGSLRLIVGCGLSHFWVIFYILYMGTVGGIGKEPISWKSQPENRSLNLILYIPRRVQHKFQAPFKMIFREKNAVDCEIWIGKRQKAFNLKWFLCVPVHVSKWFSFLLDKVPFVKVWILLLKVYNISFPSDLGLPTPRAAGGRGT